MYLVGQLQSERRAIENEMAQQQEDLFRANSDLVRAIRMFPYGSLLFNEAKTCSICLDDFKDDQLVVQLECSKFHIFHEHCMKKLLI